jgi:nuclear mRNA export protein PCID2/THP1
MAGVVQQVVSAVAQGNDLKISMLLSIPKVTYVSKGGLLGPGAFQDPSFRWATEFSRKGLPQNWSEVFAAAFHARCALEGGKHQEAFDQACAAYSKFLKMYETPEEEYWMKETLRVLAVNARRIGKIRDASGPRKPGKGLSWEVVEGLFKKGVQATAVSRAPEKKGAAIGIFNNLFKLYFDNNAIRLCKQLFKSANQICFRRGILDFDTLPLAQRVTYHFYKGRMAIFEEDYATADESFEFVLDNTPKANRKNRLRTLHYSIPVKLYFGTYPSKELLKKYDLKEFDGIVQALRSGNIHLFRETLQEHQAFFILKGVYLLLEQLKMTVYRSLLFCAYKSLDRTNKIPLKVILQALQKTGKRPIELDELECIVGSLISKGFLKGYISHKQAYLVLSKQNPFPDLVQLGKRRKANSRR